MTGSTFSSDSASSIAVYDARPFFEKALQYGVRNGIIDQPKLDAICHDAPKGMVQIASYFGSEFLQPELEKAKDRLVNLVSLYLEETCGGDLRQAAESLRDHSFLSRSKGGSDMLKRLIAMPQTSHFGMNERHGFTDDHIPQLAKWSLRSLADYRAELAQRAHATQAMDAAIWLAEALGTDAAELEEAGADADAVIRTALLTFATKHTDLPDWAAFDKMVGALRKKPPAKLTATLPPKLPEHLKPVVDDAWQSVVADLPKILDTSLTPHKLFHKTPAFRGRYFWIEDALSEVDHHDRSASAKWKKVTAGHSDEGSLITLFLCVATSTAPKTMLTERSAGTLIRKIRKTGLDTDLAVQYIRDHAPMQHQDDYVQLWQSFITESQATLKSDADYALKDALAVLRREGNVAPS
ncbi:MAG: hypothetical protein Q7V20_04295 [Aquabacterium sp.]|uniref:hypothetical protein n=1 Tax=Aquabacterium sp. TaxID=1872578 RepID=UPI00271FA5D5|nr:hypothetical protein [Aquabacterium sp.]MDO9002664.1 hypothetical protein [Aquabacterium sp.]